MKTTFGTESLSDAQLVEWSLTGDREAFGRIVERYQSLVCSVTYCATGSLSLSEDIAQETFLTAWQKLYALSDAAKLRAWLCGIARNLMNNSLRRGHRDPVHAAEPLDTICEPASTEPSPSAQAVSREEEAILWRALERIPDTYREPLILFYRENQSVENVAEELELSEDAVKQRLSRGRKLLTDEVEAFVEGTLKRTTPGKAFTVGVLAALPGFATPAKAATVGAAAAKGSATATASVLLAWAGTILGPLLCIQGAWTGVQTRLQEARSARERQYVIRSAWIRLMLVTVFCLAVMTTVFLPTIYWESQPLLITALLIVLSMGYVGSFILGVGQNRRLRHIRDEEARAGRAPASPWQAIQPCEYRSRWSFLGMPLLHFRQGRAADGKRTTSKGWIALGGDMAIGAFACAPVAVGGIAIGGAAFGLVSIGGLGLGLLTFAGCSIGWWAVGGLAVGYYAFGGSAIAWFAARGGAAIAHHFAVGAAAFAEHANDAVARGITRNNPFPFLLGTFMRCASLLLFAAGGLNLWRVLRIMKASRKEFVRES
ncbi:MAG: sigma-70 family RNA polymerase sigma factor [Verrucomicrobiia bacterium]